ncbi:DNA excision repair protein ERCC-6-like [Mactra antiquata]
MTKRLTYLRFDEDLLETEEGNLPAVSRLQHISDDVLINESGKLLFLVELLDRLKEENHRCLVFSQSRKMLDIMQKVITNRGHKVMRLDGTIAQVQEREQRIQKFQNDERYSVFLLTTQVGGVGLTLTAADRVVIFDPSWNPAVDAQAVDRAFRIGQDKNVVVYRLITCGTVEEKIYRRQIFKDSITRQTTGNAKNPYRYFSKYELRELFVLDDPHSSTTQQQLEQMHSGQRLTDECLDEHIAYLYSLDMFGLSDHDLMFSHGSNAGDDQDELNEESPENDYIQHQVQKAREIIQIESSQPSTREERIGKNTQSGIGARNYTNWDFPRPGLHRESDDEEQRDEYHVPTLNLPVKTELPNDDIKPNIKQNIYCDPINDDYIDLTSPVVIKNEPDAEQEMKKEELLAEYFSPNSGQHNGTNSSRQSDASDDSQEMEVGTPVRSNSPTASLFHQISNTPNSANRRSLSYTPKSNKKNGSVINEEILISPDSSRPLVQTRPPSVSNISSFIPSDFRPNFNSTVLKTADASGNHEAPLSTGSSPALPAQTFYQDSPVESSDNSRHPFKIIVEKSPLKESRLVNKSLNDGDVSSVDESVIIDESVVISDDDEKENMEPGTISVNDLQNILNKSLGTSSGLKELNESLSGSPVKRTDRRKSTACRKPTIDSSYEDDDDDDVGDIDDNDEVMNKGSDDGENGENDEVINNSSDDGDVMNDDDNLSDAAADDDDKGPVLIDDNDDDELPDLDDEKCSDISDRILVKTEVDDNDDNINGVNDYDGDVELPELNGEESRVRGKNDDCNEFEDIADDNDKFDGNANEKKVVDVNINSSRMETDFEQNGDVANDSKHNDDVTPDKGDDNSESQMEDKSQVDDDDDDDYDEDESEEELQGFEALPEEDQIRYNELVERGREYCAAKKYEEGQLCVLQALEIYADSELQDTCKAIQRKIMKLKMKAQLGK